MDQVSKLYVGNLDFNTTEDEIKSHFEAKGVTPKSIALIKDKYTGKAKGFGFVEVESEEVLNKAIEALEKMGKPAVPALMDALSDDVFEARGSQGLLIRETRSDCYANWNTRQGMD